MPEQEPGKMDNLLRQTMSSSAVPSLSSSFDQKLQERLRPRRLDARGKAVMVCYAIAGLLASVWVMWAESIPWIFIAAAIAIPLAVVAGFQFRRRPQEPRKARA